jgi:hypothetical protein
MRRMKRSATATRHLLAGIGAALLLLVLSPLPCLVGTSHASLRTPPPQPLTATSARAAETDDRVPLQDQSRLAFAAVTKFPFTSPTSPVHSPGAVARRADVAWLPAHRPKIPPRSEQSTEPH